MEKKIIFLSIILFSALGLKAQVNTIFYAGDKVILDSTLASVYATSYAVYGKLSNDSVYVYKKYDIENNLMLTGSFKDEALKIPHGKFTIYSDVYTFNETYNTSFEFSDKNIFVSEEGEYQNGLNIGRWSTYYPNGKIFASVNFEKGLKQGEFISYDSKSKVEIIGTYINDKKEGKWLYKRGKKIVFYVNDVEQKKVKGKVNIN